MGVSMAVSFIPFVGPLISCIIDGTFVDMIKALSTGDWATLGMCALAFVPGLKQAKMGLKAFGAVEKAGIKANRAAGLAFEKKVLAKLHLEKNTKRIKASGMSTYRIPDAFTKSKDILEIKHVRNLRVTQQTTDMLTYAETKGKKVIFAIDADYTQNADDFAYALSNRGFNNFEVLPVFP
jgi:hypothetical protein